MLVVVLVLENPDHFAIRLTNSQFDCRGHRLLGHAIPLHPRKCKEKEDEDDSKLRKVRLEMR